LIKKDIFCILTLFVILIISISGLSLCLAQPSIRRHHQENYYQKIIAEQIGGQRETVLDDGTRIDISTETEAIEVEFAHKWYEAIGQSSHYSYKTGKLPVIWLIREGEKDDKYIKRCKELCENGIQVKVKNRWENIRVNVYVEKAEK